MVQLVQLCCALEGLGFELAFRSALARAKARCRCQSLGQRLVQQSRRVAPGQQVGDDYQYDGEGNGEAQPQEKTHQRLRRRDEDDLRQRELLRIGRGCRLQRQAEHLVTQGQTVGNDETGDEEHRSRRRRPRQKHRDEGHCRHQRNPQRRFREAEHEDRDRHENRQDDGGAREQRRQDRRDRLATRYEQNNIAREGNFGDAKRFRYRDKGEEDDDNAQTVAEPAGGRTQLTAQQGNEVARIAFVHLRRPAAPYGMPVHLSITTIAVAPKRIRSSGGASSRMRTGKRAAIRTQLRVRSTCGSPPNVALTSDATPQPRLSTWPRSGRLGCAITYTVARCPGSIPARSVSRKLPIAYQCSVSMIVNSGWPVAANSPAAMSSAVIRPSQGARTTVLLRSRSARASVARAPSSSASVGLVLVMAWRASSACSCACCSAICAVRCAVRAWSTCCAVTKPCPSSGSIRPSVLEARARCASALLMPRSAAPALEVCAATWSAVRASFASRPRTAARAWSTRIR